MFAHAIVEIVKQQCKHRLTEVLSHLDKLLVQIAKLVIPGMKQRKRPSAIVNIGSAAATVSPSGPLYAVYAGSKAS